MSKGKDKKEKLKAEKLSTLDNRRRMALIPSMPQCADSRKDPPENPVGQDEE